MHRLVIPLKIVSFHFPSETWSFDFSGLGHTLASSIERVESRDRLPEEQTFP